MDWLNSFNSAGMKTRGMSARDIEAAAKRLQAAFRAVQASKTAKVQIKGKRGAAGRSTATKLNVRDGGSKTKVDKEKKRRKKKVSKSESLKKDVKRLKKAVLSKPQATFVFKSSFVNQVLHAPNKTSYKNLALWQPSTIEGAIDATPYQVITAPSSSSTANLTLVNHHQKIPCKLFAKLMIKNNHNMPFDLDYYIWEPTHDFSVTSNDLIQGLAEDLNKSGIANATPPEALTHPTIYPSDSPLWRQNSKVIEHRRVRLEPGDELTISTSESYMYDQEFYDEHAETFVKKYSRWLLMRAMGVPCHDETTTDLVGLSDGGYDYVGHRRFEFITPSDLKTLNYEVSEAYDSVTTPIITGPTTNTEKEDQ